MGQPTINDVTTHQIQNQPQPPGPTSPIQQSQPPGSILHHLCQPQIPCTTHTPPMHRYHARPSLPVIPNPNPIPPNMDPFGLHDTAA